MVKLLACAVLFLFLGTLAFAANPSVSTARTSFTMSSDPVFVWIFGYTGPYFLPQVQLGITPAQTISVAQNISAEVGRSNLNLMSVVGEEPNQPPWGLTNVNWSNKTLVSMLKSYLSALNATASGLYARLDLEEFNATNTPAKRNIFTEVSRFTNIGVNGFWLDHGPDLYNRMGKNAFNHMMQMLANKNPNDTFVVNDSIKCPKGVSSTTCSKNGWVTPLANDTWQKHTYVAATIRSGKYNQVDANALSSLGKIWACNCSTSGIGILEHFDAYAQVPSEPMGIFASQNSTMEMSAIQNLTIGGRNVTSPFYKGYNYSLIIPVLGAATYKTALYPNSTDYHGTLYNGLAVGEYARNTTAQFINYSMQF